MAISEFAELAAALRDGQDGLAAELRDRVPDEITDAQLHYLLFGLTVHHHRDRARRGAATRTLPGARRHRGHQHRPQPVKRAGPDLRRRPALLHGAQLAQLELRVVVEVLRADFPGARLAVPFSELQQADIGGIQGSRVATLPVTLRG